MSSRTKKNGVIYLLALLLLLALNLRLIFTSLSVLLPEIMAQTGLSASAAGYLTTLPVLCLGVFASLAPVCIRHLGIERTVLGLLLLLALGTALRGFGITGLFLGTALAAACIAVANVLLPVIVKRDFGRQVALATGLYTTAMTLGTSVAAAITLPLLHNFGLDWRSGLAVWAVPALIAAAFWLPRWAVKAQVANRRTKPPQARLWRDPLAWQVTFFMGLQSATAYCAMGWLAPILRSRGMDGTQAGLVLSVCFLANLIGNLLAPLLVRRFANQRGLNVFFSLLTGIPLLGFLFAPLPSVWLLALLQGSAQGGMFVMALTVIVLRSPDAASAARLSSMAQGAGYTIAALLPLLVGLIYSWSGSFAPSGWLFITSCALSCFFGWGAGCAKYVGSATAGPTSKPRA